MNELEKIAGKYEPSITDVSADNELIPLCIVYLLTDKIAAFSLVHDALSKNYVETAQMRIPKESSAANLS